MLALYCLLVILLVAYVLFRKPKQRVQATFLESRDVTPPLVTAAALGVSPSAPRMDWSAFDTPTYVRRKRVTE